MRKWRIYRASHMWCLQSPDRVWYWTFYDWKQCFVTLDNLIASGWPKNA